MLRSKVNALYLPLANAEDMLCLENILFNLPYVEERYRRTLEVCSLVTDLKILEDGDESEIGERGVCEHSHSLQLQRTKAFSRSICLGDKKPVVSLLYGQDLYH
jgi:hypothetical protein